MILQTRAFIFDLEGVIVDTEPVWDAVQTVILEKYGVTYNPKDVKHLLAGKSAKESLLALFGFYKVNITEASIDTLIIERKQIFLDLLKEKISFIDGFCSFFEQHINGQYQVAIATSLDRKSLSIIQDALGLHTLFGQHIYSIEDIGNISKPRPDIFLHAAKELNCSPHECHVIEDAPNGIDAAHNAQMRSVALATTFRKGLLEKSGPTLIVQDYAELARHMPKHAKTMRPPVLT